MVRCADSIGMMSWTSCIGSERKRSMDGQQPPRVSPIVARAASDANLQGQSVNLDDGVKKKRRETNLVRKMKEMRRWVESLVEF